MRIDRPATSRAAEPQRASESALSRRDLLQTLGLSAGGLLLFGPPALLRPGPARAAGVAGRSYVGGGPVALELDGSQSYVNSVEGGNAVATVVVEPANAGMSPGKHMGGVNFEDIVLQLPFTVAPTLASWISDTLDKGPVRRNGAISYMDLNRSEWKRLEFTSAMISEIALPACDASLKNTASLTLRLTPEGTRWVGGSGKLAALPPPSKIGVTSQSNFRLNIQGLEPACPYVSKIEALSWKLPQTASPLGQFRDYQKQPSIPEVSSLKITVAEANAGLFYTWLDNVVIRGNTAAADAERGGVLQWLGADMATVLATAQLRNLGITRYAPALYSAGADSIGRVEVDMYCEALGLKLGT